MTDVLLENSLVNWEPRCTANGIGAKDHSIIMRRLDRSDDWYRAWSTDAEKHLDFGNTALAGLHTQGALQFNNHEGASEKTSEL